VRERHVSALDEVRDLAEAVARRHSLTLWDVEVGGPRGRTIVRVFVDGDEGVDLDTVAEVSEEMSRGLDVRDPIPGRYVLEVSSPGLERRLKSPEHFALSAGSRVVVKTHDRVIPESHRVEGTILGADESAVHLAIGERQIQVPYREIKSAHTVFEWKAS
jgi:ribosome maturation factor RimP